MLGVTESQWRQCNLVRSRRDRSRPKALALCLAVAMATSMPSKVEATSVRNTTINNLEVLAIELKNYHEAFGKFPEDIRDAAGKPLLSWRVQLLPFFETFVPDKKFHLNEPWDSPHNRQLILPTPHLFRPAYDAQSKPGSVFVAPRGKTTAFGAGGPRGVKDTTDPLSEPILLIEVDDEHAPIWTKPADLVYDPASPHAGLGWRWRTGLLHEPACLAAFANGSVSLIRERIDPDVLRALFSANGGEEVRLELYWHEALFQPPLGEILCISLLLGCIAIGGASLVGYRLIRNRPTSPGEMLWFILGLQQLAFVTALVIFFRYQYVVTWNGEGSLEWFWLFPRLVGAFGCLVAI